MDWTEVICEAGEFLYWLAVAGCVVVAWFVVIKALGTTRHR